MKSLYRAMLHAAATAALILAAFAMPLGALAGDDDDDNDDDRFGAWIHTGTVDAIGDRPVDDLGELDREDGDDDFDDIPFDFGAVNTDVFWEDEEDVDLTIDQLLAGPHVVVVRETERSDARIVTAGNIEGELDDRGGLLVMLQPVDDSGYAGVAYFEPEDDDDDDEETQVTIVVWEGELPASTPTA